MIVTRILILAACFGLFPVAQAQSWQLSASEGWATLNGGTWGGSQAAAQHVYRVGDVDTLRAALSAAPRAARIILIETRIDLAAPEAGGPFKNRADQAQRGVLQVPSDTSLIGLGEEAGLVNGSLHIRHVRNVVLRNLKLVNPCDVEPRWDPKDGRRGNWNAEFDGVTIEGSQNVWIDHLHFTDAPQTDDHLASSKGVVRQCHDGALDIKNAADFVTVSDSIFESHTKTVLVGHADDALADVGHLRVSFVRNLWRNVSERAPRVRFGQVHLVNNLYVGDRKAVLYPHRYSVGLGRAAQVLSEGNVFLIEGAKQCSDLVSRFGPWSEAFFVDQDSMLNGRRLQACPQSTASTWQPSYAYVRLPTEQVPEAVLRTAGVRATVDRP